MECNKVCYVQDGLSELNGGAGDRASVLLPVVPFDPSSVLEPLPLDSRPENDQPIATVPTANGGTRRKHHRPWTLREVMTLVEGVARCGGGKWADIKKLAFSNVGYRTAVDLKVSLLSRHLCRQYFSFTLLYRSIWISRSAAGFLAVFCELFLQRWDI